jgi:hypothetical protein
MKRPWRRPCRQGRLEKEERKTIRDTGKGEDKEGLEIRWAPQYDAVSFSVLAGDRGHDHPARSQFGRKDTRVYVP